MIKMKKRIRKIISSILQRLKGVKNFFPLDAKQQFFLNVLICIVLMSSLLAYSIATQKNNNSFTKSDPTPTQAQKDKEKKDKPTPMPNFADEFNDKMLKDISINPDGYAGAGDIEIVPVKQDSAGVDFNSGFLIKSEGENYDESYFNKTISFTPKTDFKVNKVSDKEYRLNLSSRSGEREYRIDYKDAQKGFKYSWLFEGRKKLYVVSVFPRHEAINVPINSGIEIDFSLRDISNIQEHFEISPKVNGKFYFDRNKVIFAPEKLDYSTIYTITIKKGVAVYNSDEKLEEDKVFKFQTEIEKKENSNPYVVFNKDLYNFTSNFEPIFHLYGYKVQEKVKVEVIKYRNAKDFLKNLRKNNKRPSWANINDEDLDFDINETDIVSTFETKLIELSDSYYYQKLLVFPDTLNEGHYLIRLTYNQNKEAYTHIQINNNSVYLMNGKKETMVWVNDVVTDLPVENASISNETIATAYTGADGVAIIKGEITTNEDEKNTYFTIESDKSPDFIACLSNNNYSFSNYGYQYGYGEYYDFNDSQNKYWTYMYTDREAYLPGDEINIWGVLKPRDFGVIKPRNATIEINWGYYQDETPAIISQDIQIGDDGTFNTKIDLKKTPVGWYSLSLKVGDEVMMSNEFSINEYEKPAYKIEVKGNKVAIMDGESITFDINAQFFEETPVSECSIECYNSQIHYYGYSPGRSTQMLSSGKCDKNGFFSETIKPHIDTKSWRPIQMLFSAYNTQAEDTEILDSEFYRYFPKDVMIEAEAEIVDTNIEVKIDTNNITLENLSENDFEYYYFDEEKYKGEEVDLDLKVEVYQEHYEAHKTGSYYDYNEKKVRNKYKYEKSEKLLETYNIKTENGKYKLLVPVKASENNSYDNYYIKIIGHDKAKRPVEIKNYVYSYRHSYWYETPSYEQGKNYYIKEISESPYNTNEKVEIILEEENEEIGDNFKGRILFMTMQNGLLKYDVAESHKTEFLFKDEFIPNVFVNATYFDGEKIYSAGCLNLSFDKEQKRLDIDVKTDKETYKPGDDVNVAFAVKDKQGNPVQSEINISVVDEAFFEVFEQNVDIMYSLYEYTIPSGIIEEYFSYDPYYETHTFGGGAECGDGGGGVKIREDFEDTAFFDTLKTDVNGFAKISFTLPDNLTSWRLTTQAVTSDMKAGDNIHNINVNLPFFININMNDMFLENDKPGVMIKPNGTKLESGEKVEYKVVLEREDGYKKEITSSGDAFKFTGVILGQLKKGEYSITVVASKGDYKDSIRKYFKVVDNMLEASRVDYFDLSEDLKLDDIDTFTNLTFYNKDMSKYIDILFDLAYYWGDRSDLKICKTEAHSILNELYGENNNYFYLTDSSDISKYQLFDGGIGVFRYAESDPELTAKICAVSTDGLKKESLKYYFNSVIDFEEGYEPYKYTPRQVAASLWGLASLGESVKEEIEEYLEQPNIGVFEELYLANAFAQKGDFKSAYEIYTKIINEYGKELKGRNEIIIKAGLTKEDIIEATSLCSIVAFKLNTPEKDKFFNYITRNNSEKVTVDIEKLIYVTQALISTSKTGDFTYEAGGKKGTITLENDEIFILELLPSELDELVFKDVGGDIEVRRGYEAPVKDLFKDANKDVSIKRKYELVDETKISHSEIVKVRLTVNISDSAPDGYYEITDILPPALLYTSKLPNMPYDKNYRRGYNQGQKTMFNIYFDSDRIKNTYEIVYFARAFTLGDYTADHAFIKHCNSDVAGFSERQRISIVEGP